MPVELFVSYAGDLATAGWLVVVVTPVRSPPGRFCLCFRGLGNLKVFYIWAIPLHSGQVEFWSGGDVSGKLRMGRSLSGHTWWECKCIAGLRFFYSAAWPLEWHRKGYFGGSPGGPHQTH
jgi:hypothetical protein